MIVDAATAKIQQLRETYEARGYEVVENPAPREIPFECGYNERFRPSMLLRRGDEHVIVDIRESAGQATDRLVARAGEIGKHPHWHYMLVTSDDVVPHDAPGLQGAPPTWPELTHTVGEALRVAPSLSPWMQLLVWWTALEGVLRRIAVDENIPVDLLPATTLIPALYDYGLIPFHSYEPLMAAHEVHRRVRHGYGTPDEELAKAVHAVAEWLPALFPAAAERAA